jgi:hypothetical protein
VGETHRLGFALSGSRLELYDGGRPVLSVVDPTLIPASSFVGLQSSTNTGKAEFGDLLVTTHRV